MVVEQFEILMAVTVLYDTCPCQRSCIDGEYMLMVEGRMSSRSVGEDGSRKRSRESRQRWMALSQ